MIKLLRGLSVMLPRDKPCHLLGVGDIFCITNTVGFGIDTYDSSFPTKLARHGRLLVRDGCINIKSTAFLNDFGPIERGCLCFTCANHSRSYVHHLFKANELTALTLASIHNVHFMCAFMSQLREKILNDEI
ncbi:queuine tRNA-ribosyltransferase-like [Zophobas morio]|uniref:queuine tRNA-ribosyltransferase-like n=1 Tax=Zophobas morio TaxID=2755281 RepID=UPI00308330F8